MWLQKDFARVAVCLRCQMFIEGQQRVGSSRSSKRKVDARRTIALTGSYLMHCCLIPEFSRISAKADMQAVGH
jgi:hypothetical protein